MAYRSADEIIIAADSLRTIRTAQRTQILTCKIRNFGDVVFAASGDTTLPREGFSLDRIPASLHPRNDPVRAPHPVRIATFAEETIAAFTKVHNERTGTRPVSFTYILGFLLEGRPVVLSRVLKSTDGALEIEKPRELVEDEFLLSGRHQGLDDFLPASGPLDGQGPVVSLPSLLARMIGYQSRRFLTVGGPVDIIRLNADGVEWLLRKPQCRDRE